MSVHLWNPIYVYMYMTNLANRHLPLFKLKQGEKKEIWLSPMTKKNWHHQNATKTFEITQRADRLKDRQLE